MRRIGFACLLLAACQEHHAASPDAGPDPACSAGATFTPIAVSGATPAGPIDLRFAYAGYADGFCPPSYHVELTQTMNRSSCTADQALVFDFAFPDTATQPQSGSFPATAAVMTASGMLATTAQVTFEAQEVDPASSPTPRIVGNFVSSAPGWSIDIPIDLVSRFTDVCD